KIYQYNYEATKQSIERAMAGQPSADDMLGQRDTAAHPFYKG
ncbi:MAG: formaldehyde-activating enzyme, partial [Planctomycetaceae bacterium]|nr:formaldehyde-activating enzyme [Planctomycetaceae bacterium]